MEVRIHLVHEVRVVLPTYLDQPHLEEARGPIWVLFALFEMGMQVLC